VRVMGAGETSGVVGEGGEVSTLLLENMVLARQVY